MHNFIENEEGIENIKSNKQIIKAGLVKLVHSMLTTKQKNTFNK